MSNYNNNRGPHNPNYDKRKSSNYKKKHDRTRFDRRNYLSHEFNGGAPKELIQAPQTLRVVRLKVSLEPMFYEGDLLIETFPGSGYYVNFDYYQNLSLNIRDILKIRDIEFEDFFENTEEFTIFDLRDCPGLKQFYEVCVRPKREELLRDMDYHKKILKNLENELRVLSFYDEDYQQIIAEAESEEDSE